MRRRGFTRPITAIDRPKESPRGFVEITSLVQANPQLSHCKCNVIEFSPSGMDHQANRSASPYGFRTRLNSIVNSNLAGVASTGCEQTAALAPADRSGLFRIGVTGSPSQPAAAPGLLQRQLLAVRMEKRQPLSRIEKKAVRARKFPWSKVGIFRDLKAPLFSLELMELRLEHSRMKSLLDESGQSGGKFTALAGEFQHAITSTQHAD